MYGNSEIKRGAPKNKGRFALQVEGRFALPLTKEKLTNKKKEGRSARGQKKRTPLLLRYVIVFYHVVILTQGW